MLQAPFRMVSILYCVLIIPAVCLLLLGGSTRTASGLVLAPHDVDPECTRGANATATASNVVALLDSHAYQSLDRLWYADDESIDLFAQPLGLEGDTNAWELVDETACRNVWQYCGDSVTDILITQFISRGEESNIELFVGIEWNYFSETTPGVALALCSQNSENALIVEADDTFAVHTETIPCGAGRIVNDSNGQQYWQFEFTFVPMGDFEIVLRANLSDSSCVNVSRVRVFHHYCPETTVSYVLYPRTIGGMYAGECVPNAVPIEGPNTTAQCTLQGEWIFPRNLTTNEHCLCAPGYVPNGLGSECTPCPNGTYKSDTGGNVCNPCPENSHTNGPGSSICRCNAAYVRPDPSDVASSCEACAQNFYHMSGVCIACPLPGSMDSFGDLLEQCRCLNGSANLNSTSAALDHNSTSAVNSTCDYCARNYYRNSTDDSCQLCPRNSFREVDLHRSNSESTCNCNPGGLTAGISRQTTVDPCDRCDTTHYRYGSGCRQCPSYSSSVGLLDSECACESNTTTPDGSTTTTNVDCVCMDGLFRPDPSGDCIPCPINSNRNISVHDDFCPCDFDYKRKSGSSVMEQCYGPIIGFDQPTLEVLEGDTKHTIAVRVLFSFPILETEVVGLNVTGAVTLLDHLILPTGETYADYSIVIEGDKTALETDQFVKVVLYQVRSGNNNIIGSGDGVRNQFYYSEVTLTILEDDIVYVGFTLSNFNSSVSAGYLELVLTISAEIERELAIEVIPNVTLSVFSLQNTILTFVPNGSRVLTVPIQLSETRFLVDAYYVRFDLNLVEKEFLRDEVRLGGATGFNNNLTLVLFPPLPKGLSRGAEIGLISFFAVVLIAILAVTLLAVLWFCRRKMNQLGHKKNRSLSSNDDQGIDSKTEVAMEDYTSKAHH